MASFPQWDLARRLNLQTNVSPDECRYVVLLTETYSFRVEKDLKKTLKINKKPLVWFVKTFREHRVRVEYTTCFTQSELNVLGPIASQQSHGIVRRLFQKQYPSTVRLVGGKFHVRRVWGDACPYASLSIETFRDQICS